MAEGVGTRLVLDRLFCRCPVVHVERVPMCFLGGTMETREQIFANLVRVGALESGLYIPEAAEGGFRVHRAHFDNTVKTEWIEDSPRDMLLLEAVRFTGSNGKTWTAPAGSVINGANIPRLFWLVVGSPFIGRYRRATVLHDVYCGTMTEPYQAVHRMFYEAMLCDRVDHDRAEVMFKAVWLFGPKWDTIRA